VQIIIDNESNYKKACKMTSRKFLIVWQPCLAQKINLMLKAIGEFPEHTAVIHAARRIYRWLYNHNKLHAIMRPAIGGELVKCNATRFGTNYMFLESMHHRRDKVMTWMASPTFLESRFANTDEGRFAHSCLSSLTWWETMEFVLKGLEPLYAFLRFADQDKVPNLSEVFMRFSMVENEYKNLVQGYPADLRKYLYIIRPRARDVQTSSYVNAGTADFSLWLTVRAYVIVFKIPLLMCSYTMPMALQRV
jgi:hypothetical protein